MTDEAIAAIPPPEEMPVLIKEKPTKTDELISSIWGQTKQLGWKGTFLHPDNWEIQLSSKEGVVKRYDGPLAKEIKKMIETISPIVDQIIADSSDGERALQYLGLAEILRRGILIQNEGQFSASGNWLNMLENQQQFAKAMVADFLVYSKIATEVTTNPNQTVETALNLLNPPIPLSKEHLMLIKETMLQMGAQQEGQVIRLKTTLPETVKQVVEGVTADEFVNEIIKETDFPNWPGYLFEERAKERLAEGLRKVFNELLPMLKEQNLSFSSQEEMLRTLSLAHVAIDGPKLGKTKPEALIPVVPDFSKKVADPAKWNRALVTMGLVYPKLEGEPRRDKKMAIEVAPSLQFPALQEKSAILRQTIKNLGGQEALDGTVALETSLPEMILSIAHTTAAPTSK